MTYREMKHLMQFEGLDREEIQVGRRCESEPALWEEQDDADNEKE